MKTYRVKSVEEAVALANKLKAQGSHDWFRGQVRDWPPHSSLFRNRAKQDQALETNAEVRLGMFCKWVGSVPELQYLLEPEHVHDLFAIMQHYGIPTHYIDFTTDPAVAGFFAADTKSPPTEGNACIYCLDSKDLMSLWDSLKEVDERTGAHLELVQIDVRNLWRLEAQHGVFLFADYNWDIDYPMDRILFPYSGYPSFPTRSRMYPEDKSHLEQLLDQYFSIEASTFTSLMLMDLIDANKKRGGVGQYAYWQVFDDGFHAEAFRDLAQLRDFNSWNSQTLSPWLEAVAEKFDTTIGSTMHLKLKSAASPLEVKNSIEFGIGEILRSDPKIRSQAVEWVFDDSPAALSKEAFTDAFRAVWNGMRRLPYASAEISEALGTVAALFMLIPATDETSAFSELWGQGVKVGFSYSDGSGSVGWITRASLRNARRHDLASLVVPKHQALANDDREVFRIIYNPRLMFEFDAFKKAFAREVIPAQAAMRRTPLLFNPAQLRIFGIP